MKKFVSILLLFVFIGLQAQQMNDYKYIIVPEKFSDFEKNQYQLNFLLKQLLNKKNYTVLSDNAETWPDEVKENPCLALKTDVVKESSWRKNILNVIFTKCNGTDSFKYNGTSNIKEFKEGYQDAMKLAMQQVKVSMPKAPATFVNEGVSVPETSTISQGNTSDKGIVESGNEYKNGNTVVILTELKDGSFVLIEKDSSTIIAQLKPATRKGIYHVTISTGGEKYSTIGYMDGQTIGIEYLNSSKNFELKEFKKLP